MRCGALNESPSEKEGKSAESASDELLKAAALNESPSEKEGKYGRCVGPREQAQRPQ